MKKSRTLLQVSFIIIVIALIAAFIVLQQNPRQSPSGLAVNTGTSGGAASFRIPLGPPDYSQLPAKLLQTPLINDLPESSILMLRFYNFNTGARDWEKSFIIKKNSVAEGYTEADITIVMHSKYVNAFTGSNLCDVVRAAQSGGDFGTETTLSTFSLMWKFKSILSYRSCLGM